MKKYLILVLFSIILTQTSCVDDVEMRPLDEIELFLKRTEQEGKIIVQNSSRIFEQPELVEVSTYLTKTSDEVLQWGINERKVLMKIPTEEISENHKWDTLQFKSKDIYGTSLSITWANKESEELFYVPTDLKLNTPLISNLLNENKISVGTRLEWEPEPSAEKKNLEIRISGDKAYNIIYTEDDGSFLLTSELFENVKKGEEVTVFISRYNMKTIKREGKDYDVVAMISKYFYAIYE